MARTACAVAALLLLAATADAQSQFEAAAGVHVGLREQPVQCDWLVSGGFRIGPAGLRGGGRVVPAHGLRPLRAPHQPPDDCRRHQEQAGGAAEPHALPPDIEPDGGPNHEGRHADRRTGCDRG